MNTHQALQQIQNPTGTLSAKPALSGYSKMGQSSRRQVDQMEKMLESCMDEFKQEFSI